MESWIDLIINFDRLLIHIFNWIPFSDYVIYITITNLKSCFDVIKFSIEMFASSNLCSKLLTLTVYLIGNRVDSVTAYLVSWFSAHKFSTEMYTCGYFTQTVNCRYSIHWCKVLLCLFLSKLFLDRYFLKFNRNNVSEI